MDSVFFKTRFAEQSLKLLGETAQVINRIMAEPDLAAAFQKPKVMQAIMESQQNPMAIMKYQDDPDVMMVRHTKLRSSMHTVKGTDLCL